jgi:hypothetical protein
MLLIKTNFRTFYDILLGENVTIAFADEINIKDNRVYSKLTNKNYLMKKYKQI